MGACCSRNTLPDETDEVIIACLLSKTPDAADGKTSSLSLHG
jgi:hypothetical protein